MNDVSATHKKTWKNEDAVDTGYGGKVTWVGYCNDPHPGEAVIENVKEATVFAAGSYDSVTYCEVCNEQLSSEEVAIMKLKPTIRLSATKKTLKKGKTYKLKVSNLANGDAVKSFKTSKKSSRDRNIQRRDQSKEGGQSHYYGHAQIRQDR